MLGVRVRAIRRVPEPSSAAGVARVEPYVVVSGTGAKESRTPVASSDLTGAVPDCTFTFPDGAFQPSPEILIANDAVLVVDVWNNDPDTYGSGCLGRLELPLSEIELDNTDDRWTEPARFQCALPENPQFSTAVELELSFARL